MRRLVSTFAVILLFCVPALAAEVAVLTPAAGYCSRFGELWVVVKYKGTPEVWVDGAKTPVEVTEAEGVRHMKVRGIKPGGSELKIRLGDSVETLKIAGSTASGKGSASFHSTSWKNCVGCHSYEPGQCKSCHSFKTTKHSECLKCDDCHKTPGQIPSDASPLCSKCHKDVNIKSHKKLKHPLSGANDPRRPGKLFDCVSCHNPHTPACLGDLKKTELQEWCKNCHSR